MLRAAVRRLAPLAARAAAPAVETAAVRGTPAQLAHEAFRNFRATPTPAAAHGPPASGTKPDFEHATGLELKELEAAAEGDPLFERDLKWLNAPMGTQENPVKVTSIADSRIVGATDEDDDSIVHWGLVRAGAPPVKIGQEWFTLLRIHEAGEEHH